MVLGFKTEMSGCYPHKTSNIAGNYAETVSQGDSTKSKTNIRLTAAKERDAGQTERQ